MPASQADHADQELQNSVQAQEQDDRRHNQQLSLPERPYPSPLAHFDGSLRSWLSNYPSYKDTNSTKTQRRWGARHGFPYRNNLGADDTSIAAKVSAQLGGVDLSGVSVTPEGGIDLTGVDLSSVSMDDFDLG